MLKMIGVIVVALILIHFLGLAIGLLVFIIFILIARP